MSEKDRTGEEERDEAAEAGDEVNEARASSLDDEADDREVVPRGEDASIEDESARRVAKSLGLEDDDEGEAKADEAAEGEGEGEVQNRAARRRGEAVKRKRERRGQSATPADEELPKDRNARAKELLKRRREQAAEAKQPPTLQAGELVDDALARSASAAGKWLKKNFGAIQWVILAAAVAGGGWALWSNHTQSQAAAATGALFSGVSAEEGAVMAEDKRPDEVKEIDPTRVFKTVEEKTEAALAGYRKTMAEFPNSVPATLAKLGEAGVLLDKGDHAGAQAAYEAVLASKVAGGDADVKGRALEGVGFAKEGKKDLDGALASFKQMESVDARGFKELAMYHQARVLFAKGDVEGAKGLIKQVRDKLQTQGNDAQGSKNLGEAIDALARRIDPSLAPPKMSSFGGPKGGAMTPEELEKLKRILREAAEKKGHEDH